MWKKAAVSQHAENGARTANLRGGAEWVICSLKNASVCGCAVWAHNQGAKVSASTMQPCCYGNQERETPVEVEGALQSAQVQ